MAKTCILFRLLYKVFLCNFNRATIPSNTLKYLFYLSFTHSPFLSSFFAPLSCVSKPFRFSLTLALTSHADGNVILLTCTLSLLILLHLFFLCGSVELSVNCQQSRFHLVFFFTIHTQYLGVDWDLDSSSRLTMVGALACSFQTIGNTQPTLPYVITTHLNPMWLL